MRCSDFEINRLVLSRIHHLEADGFAANVAQAEFIKQAWLSVQDRLVDIGLDLDIVPERRSVRVGQTLTVRYVVANTGDVPIAALRVEDFAVGPIQIEQRILPPGEELAATKTIEVTSQHAPRLQLSAQVEGQDPFGRLVGVGGASATVRVTGAS